jgi:hypothetical protein
MALRAYRSVGGIFLAEGHVDGSVRLYEPGRSMLRKPLYPAGSRGDECTIGVVVCPLLGAHDLCVTEQLNDEWKSDVEQDGWPCRTGSRLDSNVHRASRVAGLVINQSSPLTMSGTDEE